MQASVAAQLGGAERNQCCCRVREAWYCGCVMAGGIVLPKSTTDGMSNEVAIVVTEEVSAVTAPDEATVAVAAWPVEGSVASWYDSGLRL